MRKIFYNTFKTKRLAKILGLVACLVLCVFMFGCEEDSEILTHYNLCITFDNQQKTLAVTEAVDYYNNSDSVLDYVCFHLYPSAFREGSSQSVVSLLNRSNCYYNGASFGGIEILSVSGQDVENHEITGVDENILKINLSKPLKPQESCSILIQFNIKLPNINHRFGYGENAINVANFYPIACVYENGEFMTKPYHSNGDPFYSAMADFEVELTYPKELILSNTGIVQQQNEQDEMITAKIVANKVRDFAFVLSDKFETVSANAGETTITYYYYDDENAQTSLQTAVDSILTFNEIFGEYPYKTLSVVKTNFVHGGMEYPNLVYISDAVEDYSDYQNVIIHEIAHQWWYNLVGSNAFDNGWQDEGLTDYSTAMFYEKNPQYGRTLDTTITNATQNYAFFVDVYSSVYGQLDTSMTRSLDEYPTDPEYVYIAYVKSMIMFDSLREFLGDDDFFEGLRLYFETYKYKIAQPQDMIACFSKVAPTKNVESFFDAWLNGNVLIVAP